MPDHQQALSAASLSVKPYSNYTQVDPLIDFPWPKTPQSDLRPQWDGKTFHVDSVETRFLSYSVADSAWSHDLTEMHETEVATTHPITILSRRRAVESMRLLGATPIILDAGCMSGLLIEELRRCLPAAGVIGADYLSGVVASTSSRIPGVPFVQFDLRACPFPDQSIDGITSLNVLEHIDSDVQALREIHRMLKIGGLAHIEVPASPACYDLYDEVLMHHRRYKASDLAKMCREIGFSIEAITHSGFFAYPMFRLVKTRNRYLHRNLPLEEKRKIVIKHIRETNQNWLLDRAFSFERFLGKWMQYPNGIRAVLRLRRTLA
jgi:ubiquinone/menaquinone biosynthesis C-methylase UbiE